MNLHQSGEDYLEAILLLQHDQKHVRSIDIANQFGYSKASVSRAMKILKEKGYIIFTNQHYILLTKEGENRAKEIYERHRLIREFLMKSLHLSETQAEEDACKIEHILSDTAFMKIKDYLKNER